MAVPSTSLREVTVRYGDTVALDIDELTLGSGVTGLVGVNGAGKTSLLHTLIGLARPTSGNVVVAGAAVSRRTMLQVRRRVGLAPQHFRAPGNLTVQEAVTYLGWLRGLSAVQARERAAEAIALMHLADRAHSRIDSLSGGMLRRVAIAQAVVHHPSVLLLDEPTAGLDPVQRRHVRDVVARAATGRTTVVSSHLLDDVVRWADRILVLDEGRIVFHGDLEDFWTEAHRRGVPGRDGELAFLALTRSRD